jgi:hypothetical protein
MARWRRVAGPLDAALVGDRHAGWTWRVEREGAGTRDVRVEVSSGIRSSDPLPAASREAILTLGASAVDAFLDEAEPPSHIVVLTVGVQARDLY